MPTKRGAVRQPDRRSRKATRKPSAAAKSAKKTAKSKASIKHQIKVGQTLIENVEGHAARTDSPEFVSAVWARADPSASRRLDLAPWRCRR